MEEIDSLITFDQTILRWVDLAKIKAFARVDLACQLDAQVNYLYFLFFLVLLILDSNFCNK